MYVEHVTMIGDKAASEWRWISRELLAAFNDSRSSLDDPELAAEFDRVKAMRERAAL